MHFLTSVSIHPFGHVIFKRVTVLGNCCSNEVSIFSILCVTVFFFHTDFVFSYSPYLVIWQATNAAGIRERSCFKKLNNRVLTFELIMLQTGLS